MFSLFIQAMSSSDNNKPKVSGVTPEQSESPFKAPLVLSFHSQENSLQITEEPMEQDEIKMGSPNRAKSANEAVQDQEVWYWYSFYVSRFSPVVTEELTRTRTQPRPRNDKLFRNPSRRLALHPAILDRLFLSLPLLWTSIRRSLPRSPKEVHKYFFQV